MDFFNGNVFGLDQVHPVTVVVKERLICTLILTAMYLFVVTTQEDSHHMKHLEMPIYAKWDTNGVLQWQRYYGDTGYNSTTKKNDEEQAEDIITDSAGNVIVVGTCEDVPPAGKYHDTNGFVLKCDSYGVPLWQRVISGTGYSGSSAGAERDLKQLLLIVQIISMFLVGLTHQD